MGSPRKADLKDAFPPPTAAFLKRIGSLAERRGVEAYLVGGIVRDAVLGTGNADLDIAVVGDGLGFARHLARDLKAKVRLHDRFLTAKLQLPGNRGLDVATARREHYERAGALPQVSPASLAEDLGRRDISINAMAMAVNPASFGSVYDPYDGRGDLDRKIIRILYANSLMDDPTRMVRMARFAARFGFDLDGETEARLREALSAGALDLISADRRRRELMLVLSEKTPGKALGLLEKWGILKLLLPGVIPPPRCGETLRRAARLLKRAGPAANVEMEALGLAILLSGATERLARQAVLRLGLAGRNRIEVEQAWRSGALKRKLRRAARPSAISGVLKGVPLTVQFATLALAGPGRLGLRLERYLCRTRLRKPVLTGDDLRRMGLSPGPEMRKLLERLLAKALDGELKDRRAAESFVRSCLASGGKHAKRGAKGKR